MIPTYCPRCGKPLLPDARRCPFCGLETGFVPGPPGVLPEPSAPFSGGWPSPPVRSSRQPGWGLPQPDQSGGKTAAIVGCLIVAVLLLFVLPFLAVGLLMPSLLEQLRDLPSFPPGFPPDFPFPSFAP